MLTTLSAVLLLALVAAPASVAAEEACPAYSTFVIGTFSTIFGEHTNATGRGVTILRLSDLKLEQVAQHGTSFVGPDPNYVALDGSSLHIINAVNAPRGGLTTLTFTDSPPFVRRQAIVFEAEHPAHVSVAYPHSRSEPVVLVANFFGGNAFAFMKGPDGQLRLTGEFEVPEKHNPPPGITSHVHSVFPYRQSVIVADYGTDKVFRLAISREGELSLMQTLHFNKKDEPRHSAIHVPTDTVYVLMEWSQSLVTLKRGMDDILRPTQRVNIMGSGVYPEGTASAIRISRDYRFVYAAVRRDPEDAHIAAFPILEDGSLGERLGEWSLHGVHPRDFFLAEDIRVGNECRSYVAVVHMRTNALKLIRRDPVSGLLADTPDLEYMIHTPTSVLQI